MAIRYRVARQTVRFGKQTYRVGELMPVSFSERDLYRVLYPSRLEKVEVPDETATPTTEVKATPVEEKANTVPQEEKPAEKTPAAPTKPSGTSLSGRSVVK